MCKDFKAPDRIDPRLLDPKYVFKEVEELSGTATGIAGGGGKGIDIFNKKNVTERQRQRDGYDDKLGPLLTRRCSVAEFVRVLDPVRALADYSGFDFDEQANELGYTTHPKTTEEIKTCCADLKVVGRAEFKALLKWRLMIRHSFPDTLKSAQKKKADGDEEEAADEEEDEEGEGADGSGNDDGDDDEGASRARKELSAVAAAELSRRKREKKRETKVRQTAIRRQRRGMNLRNVDMLDTDDSLFSLAKLRKYAGGAEDALDAVVDVDLDKDDEASLSAAEDEEVKEEPEDDDVELDGDDVDAAEAGDGAFLDRMRAKEKVSKLDSLEDELDTAYARYIARQEAQAEQSRSVAESGKISHGIKLTRREKLERQALLTEAALNSKLDAEHQRYLRMLGGVRSSDVIDEEAVRAVQRRAHAGGDDDDENKDEDDSFESEDSEEEGDADEIGDGVDGSDGDDEEGSVAEDDGGKASKSAAAAAVCGPAAAKAKRWFSQLGVDGEDDGAADGTLGLSLGGSKNSGNKAAKNGKGKKALNDDSSDDEEDGLQAMPLPRAGLSEAAGRKAKRAASNKDAGDDEEGAEVDVDSDGDAYPDWLGGIAKSDREKWKDKLRKRRERLEKSKSRHEAKESKGIEVVPMGAAADKDVDEEFDEIAEMEIAGGAKRDGAARADDDGDERMDGVQEEGAQRSRKQKELIRAGMGRALKSTLLVNQDDDEAADGNGSATVLGKRGRAGGAPGAGSAFEVVPAGVERQDIDDDSDSDSDSDDSDDSGPDPREANYDSDTHAEMLALGKKLKKHTTAKALVDASYNRYSFSDSALPAWFATDENRHFRPQLPISKDEVEAIKTRFRDIAARPIHKVAEARARKKRKLVASLDKAKRQAATIVEDEELGAKSKMKAIAKAYRQAEVKRPNSVYVVAGGKGGKKGKGGKVKMVDPRMKKEKKAAKRAAKKSGRKGGKGGKGRK